MRLLFNSALLFAAVWARIPEAGEWQQKNLAAVEKGRPHHGNDDGCDHCNAGFHPESVKLLPGVGAYSFNFGDGNSGNTAYQYFYFTIPNDSLGYQVRLWDCFCNGDGFYGVFTQAPGPTNGLFAFGNVFTSDCAFYQNTSEDCWEANFFYNYGTEDLTQPGFYNLTIEVARSPYRKGTGFVALLPLCVNTSNSNLDPCCELQGGCDLSQYR